jgi:hypothetical protein
MKYIACYLFIFISCLYGQQLSEDFRDSLSWKINASDGVLIAKSFINIEGENAVKLDYNFAKGSGYGGIQKQFNLDLPDNYEISFYIKAKSPRNTLEFKLIDSTGNNVWWVNKKNFEFPSEWKRISIKKRNISFAWGPAGGGMPKHIAKIEIIITASTGGKGEVYLKNLTLNQIPEADTNITNPNITASKNSFLEYSGKLNELKWESGTNASLIFGFNNVKDISGIVLNWDKTYYPKSFNVCTSNDSLNWKIVNSQYRGKPGTSIIQFKDNEAKYYKIVVEKPQKDKFILTGIQFMPSSFADTYNNLFYKMAEISPAGMFPKYFSKKQAYWNVSGAFHNNDEMLINTEGQIETNKQSFSLEPFVKVNDQVYSWANSELSQSLQDNYIPISSVVRDTKDFSLKITCLSSNLKGNSRYLIYEVKNGQNTILSGDLYIAIRPFQVNPPWQNLNFDGGYAPLKSIHASSNNLIINNGNYVQTYPRSNALYVSYIDEGEIAECIYNNTLQIRKDAEDPNGLLSAALKFPFTLKPGEKKQYYIRVSDSLTNNNITGSEVKENYKYTYDTWKDKLNKIEMTFPKGKEKVLNTLKSNLAYILINMDSCKIQPGSRSYERSWIRDGSLTSDALLKFGMSDIVKDYLNWYSKYLYENGKVPCVVDRRGPDPVNENDSNGEFIFAILQYYYFTKDINFLKDKFPLIVKAVGYLDYMISQRSTDYYKEGNDSLQSLYGLMPESISHEGYSAKPMHSYWDDFFTIRGLKDAATIADILGEKEYSIKFAKLRDTFSSNLYKSINRTIERAKINYIPGCADMGDFDATSTAISLFPAQERKNLPQPFLDSTFSIYYSYFKDRKNNLNNWVNYTPYEVRLINTFTLLNKPEIANELLDYFLKDQRPANFNHWAEVVWRNRDTNIFLGDMPHTWVGSDYINSIRNMLVFEEENNSSLSLFKGITSDWFAENDTLSAKNMPTYYGNIDFSVIKENGRARIHISGDLKLPENGILVYNFLNSSHKTVQIKKLPYEFILSGE